jgi:hypothetical protein
MFATDLKKGQEMENAVALYYQRAGYRLERAIGCVKEWDMVISAGVEVKYDLQAPQTGNFAFEFRCRGTPSGLSTTKALFWVLCTSEGAWEAEVSTLKKWVKDYGTDKNGKLLVVRGGDDKESELILVDYDLIKQFKTLWTV